MLQKLLANDVQYFIFLRITSHAKMPTTFVRGLASLVL